MLESFRFKGIGNIALKMTEDLAISKGFKYMRLFTDRINLIAIEFYKKNGYTFEAYENEEEGLKDLFDVVIGSKSISELEVPEWNNKFINMTKQTIKQQ